MKMLHVYSPEYWHQPAYIMGTRDSLERLRNTIDEAIRKGQQAQAEFVADGEGYVLVVACASADEMEKAPLPYVDEVAKEKDDARWGVLSDRFKLCP